jgi:hypothetical protein
MKFILFMLLQQTLAFQERPLLAIPNEKLCKNCKFFKKKLFDENKFGHCTRFPFQATNNYFLVDGVKDTSPTSYHYCSTARSFDHMCGPEGRGYTPTTP